MIVIRVRERIYIIRKEYPETANDRWVLTPQTRAEVLDHLSGEPGVPGNLLCPCGAQTKQRALLTWKSWWEIFMA